MAREERIIYVYDDFSCDEPVLLGKLYVGVIKQGETYSFEYDKEWLTNNKSKKNGELKYAKCKSKWNYSCRK